MAPPLRSHALNTYTSLLLLVLKDILLQKTKSLILKVLGKHDNGRHQSITSITTTRCDATTWLGRGVPAN